MIFYSAKADDTDKFRNTCDIRETSLVPLVQALVPVPVRASICLTGHTRTDTNRQYELDFTATFKSILYG
jgi:hypothetical protein